MAVTVVATAGSATANSFCTLAELKVFILTRLHNSTNVALVGAGTTIDDTANRALVSFTRILDQQVDWDGTPTDYDTQALQWPRNGLLDALGNILDDTIIPQRLKDALCEGAIYLIDSDITAANSADGISQLKVGPIYMQFTSEGPPRKPIPDAVWDMIALWGRRKYGASGQVRLVRC